MPGEEDIGLWKWLAGGALTIVGGIVGGTWTARGLLEQLRQTDADHERRLLAMERSNEEIRDMATNIAVLVALHGEMQKDIEAIFSRLNRREHNHGRQEGDRRGPNAQVDG